MLNQRYLRNIRLHQEVESMYTWDDATYLLSTRSDLGSSLHISLNFLFPFIHHISDPG